MFLPTLERFLESFFWNGEQLLCRIFLDLVRCVETASFQGRLQLRKQEKVRWSQIWRVGWLGYNSRFVFRQKIALKERQVSWRIVVVQHPTLVHPQPRPLQKYGFPSNASELLRDFSNLSDSQTAILENQITNCIDVNVFC